MSTAPPAEPSPPEPAGTGAPATAPADGPTGIDAERFVRTQNSPEFAELRSAHRSFAFPLTVAFVLWYLAYVLLSNYAGPFMATKLFGNVNVALVLGLAQFLTTFLIAWWYSHHAATRLDPRAREIRSRLEGDA
ncbi:DUF485 domain-containing protein [Streptomyces sp. NPDC059740]|uniref:DUF485 domain-containing protein n=1 Tax=Streptomyces sp. NPDC059740 TaxID=3346926 RepID=UPI003659CCF2